MSKRMERAVIWIQLIPEGALVLFPESKRMSVVWPDIESLVRLLGSHVDELTVEEISSLQPGHHLPIDDIFPIELLDAVGVPSPGHP